MTFSAFVIAAAMLTVPVDAPSSAPTVVDGAIVRLKCGGGTGTAFLIAGDTFITANHVIADDRCGMWDAQRGNVAFEVQTQDVSADLVIASIPSAERATLAINCEGMTAGERYWMVGYANKMERTTSLPVTATASVVNARMPSGLARGLRMVEQAGGGRGRVGMSGGPVLDAQGRVVAINSAVGTNSGEGQTYVKELKDTPACRA